jgi:hypothetical protein
MTVAQWIITAGAVVGALGIIFHTVIKPVIKWGTRIEQAVSLVESNMFKNGGSSMRDAINRIEERITFVEAYITKPD